MKNNIYFTTSSDDIKKVNDAFKDQEKKYDEHELLKEEKYYNDTIDLIDEVSINPSTSWNYWNQLYGQKDYPLLKEEPYFGSINIKNEGRIYIGKQSFFDYRNSKNIVHDWRSSFGDAYYSRKTHTFLEKRPIILEDIRKYTYKFYYDDLLHDYSAILKDELMLKKAGYLGEVIKTIDELQNEIIRGQHKKIEVILGGPGTGKTTIGFHILSYKTYNFVEKNNKYPKILIIIPNEIFKYYIVNVLNDLDLYGKNYHNTEIITMDDFFLKNYYEVDYIFIDESQDIIIKMIDRLSKINYKTLYISGDSNQRLLDENIIDWDNIVEMLAVDSNDYRIRKMNINYRNSKEIIDLSNQFVIEKQESAISKSSKIYYKMYLKKIFPEESLIKDIKEYLLLGNLAIITMPEKIEFVRKTLDAKNIKFDLFENLFKSENNVFLLTVKESKGLEFDNVIIVDVNSDDEIVYNRLYHVAISRTLNNLTIYGNSYDEVLVKYYKGSYNYNFLNQFIIDSYGLITNQQYNFDELDVKNTVKYLLSNNIITVDFIDYFLDRISKEYYSALLKLYKYNSEMVIERIFSKKLYNLYLYLCSKTDEKVALFLNYEKDEKNRFLFYKENIKGVVNEIVNNEISLNEFNLIEKYLSYNVVSQLSEKNEALLEKYFVYLIKNHNAVYMINYALENNDELLIRIIIDSYSVEDILKSFDSKKYFILYENKIITNESLVKYLNSIINNDFQKNQFDYYIDLIVFLIEKKYYLKISFNVDLLINYIFKHSDLETGLSIISSFKYEELVPCFKTIFSISVLVKGHENQIREIINKGIYKIEETVKEYINANKKISISLKDLFIKKYLSNGDKVYEDYLIKVYDKELYLEIKKNLLSFKNIFKYIKFVNKFKKIYR